MIDLIKNAKTRSFWETLTKEQQRDADLLIKWDERGLEKRIRYLLKTYLYACTKI